MKVIKVDSSAFERKKQKLLAGIGDIVWLEAWKRCPRDTGNLQNSLGYVVEDNKVSIGTVNYPVPYAKNVEYGTSVLKKRYGAFDPENPIRDWAAKRRRGSVGQTMPFLRPALFVSVPKIKAFIKRECR